MKPNADLRRYASGHGVFLWQVAQRMHIHVNTLINRMRIAFTDEEAKDFMKIVDDIAEAGR